jgi:DNA-binding MarR family transcriptional regulator
MDKTTATEFFAFFNEVGIISQLSRALFEARLPDGFLLPHFSVLNHLVRVHDGRTPLELASAFQVPKTTMSHTLSVLEKHGLVELRPNPDDGRSKRVWLTAQGETFRAEALQSLNPDIVELARLIPTETVAGLLPQLSEIRQIMDARRDG